MPEEFLHFLTLINIEHNPGRSSQQPRENQWLWV
mgnify:CR=1 FL=1